MGWGRWLGIAAAVAGACALAIWVARSDEPDGPVEVEVISSVLKGRASARRLPCTTARQPANFDVYSLGDRLGELELTAVVRTCNRSNTVSYLYGTCTPPEEGGCLPPLEVETYPVCERRRRAVLPSDLTERRGVPAVVGDGMVEIYSGDSKVVVWAQEARLVGGAVRALRPVRPSSAPADLPPRVKEPRRRLPPPLPGAVRGALRCD